MKAIVQEECSACSDESPQELLPVRGRPARVPQNPDSGLPSDENLALCSNGAKFKFLEQIIYITVIPFSWSLCFASHVEL